MLFRSAHWLLALALIWATSGCTMTTTITPPPVAPDEAVDVYLIDFGYTSGLALPAADGRLVRYVYGDWRWYAESERGVRSGFNALMRSSQGALGRGRYEVAADQPEAVRRALAPLAEHVHRFQAPRPRVDRLRERLDRIFQQNNENMRYNEEFDLEFVPHPDPYRLGHNSNHKTAQWMRELGAQVGRINKFSKWEISD